MKVNISRFKILKGVPKEVRLFVYCILISTVLWLFLSLNRVYNTNVNITVKYVYSNSKTYKEAFPKFIKINLNSTGWYLIKHQLKIQEEPLIIYPEKYSGTQITAKDISQRLMENDKIFLKATIIQPEYISIEEEARLRKVLPIKNKIKISTKLGYGLFDSIHFNPAFVTIIGPKSTIENIQFIETVDSTIKNISVDTAINIRLSNKIGSSLKFETKKTHAYIPISLLTQKELVKTLDINQFKSNSIFIPSKVKIIYQVPILMNDAIDEDLFQIGYQNRDEMETGKIKLTLKNCPHYITKYRIEPEFVNLFTLNQVQAKR